MTYAPFLCHCGAVFETTGTTHGQPSGLWNLLEHIEIEHKGGER